MRDALLIIVLTAATASGQMVSFPGTRSEVSSPNGRYLIQDIRAANVRPPVPAHSLILIDKKNGSKVTIHQYLRHVDILWSPGSDAVVINDYGGSNFSTALLYPLPWTGESTGLLDSLSDFLQSHTKAYSFLENDHLYFTVRRWLNRRKLLCRLEGHGDVNPAGFTRYYVYEIGKGFQAYHQSPR